MFHLELGVDFDRGFSSGFSPPDIFRPFSVFAHAHRVSKSVTKSVSFLRERQEKNSATKSVAKSVARGRKIHRKIRHSYPKNPLQFHSAEMCALYSLPFLILRVWISFFFLTRIFSSVAQPLTQPPAPYMGKMGSICHFPRALLPAYGHTALKS